jgi:Rab-GTPase-TBC domain
MQAKDTDIIAIINIIRSKGDHSAEDLLQLKRYGVKHGFGFENEAVPEHVNKKDLRFNAYIKILMATSNSESKKGYQTEKILDFYEHKSDRLQGVKEGDVIEKDCKRSLHEFHKDEGKLKEEQRDLELQLKAFFKVIQDKSYYQGLNSVMSVLKVYFDEPKQSLQIFEGLIKNHLS